MVLCQENTNGMYPLPQRHESPPNSVYNYHSYYTNQPAQYTHNQDYNQFGMDSTYQGAWATQGMYSAPTRNAHTSLEDWSNNYCMTSPFINPAMTQSMASYYNRSLPGNCSSLDYVETSPVYPATQHSPTLTALGSSPSDCATPSPSNSSSSISPASSGGKTIRPPYDWMKQKAYQNIPSSAPSNGKTRTKDKYRVVYTDHQRLELEKEFHYSRYITIRRKAELANALNLSERQVKIWFQNRRAKERKVNKKSDVGKMESLSDISPEQPSVHSSPQMDNSLHIPVIQHAQSVHTPVTSLSANPLSSNNIHPFQMKQEISPSLSHSASEQLSPLALPLHQHVMNEELSPQSNCSV
uniref:Homeobox parahox cdx n=1 Tax=Antalis entalis TaxID=211836 RepID=A0A1J0M5L1_9MOLL|nr:homeobox parahox cdx [Antalis entalis]